jgi:hypothetical protein
LNEGNPRISGDARRLRIDDAELQPEPPSRDGNRLSRHLGALLWTTKDIDEIDVTAAGEARLGRGKTRIAGEPSDTIGKCGRGRIYR